MSDYERIADAISYLTQQVCHQPTLDEVAAHVHLSPYHFQRLFCRWAGVSPKKYLQVLTLERAKQLLQESKSLLEVSDNLGLSSSSRLYDHFVHLEAVTPGEFKSGGKGTSIDYGVHDTPFGMAFIGVTEKGICALEFLDDALLDKPLARLKKAWPKAMLHNNPESTQAIIEQVFISGRRTNHPLSLIVSGTNFQINVWKALLNIAPGTVTSYTHIANVIGRPAAARAVGNAVGDNPVAYLIPCHRVIQQSGQLGGYRWGADRKRVIHAWESARLT